MYILETCFEHLRKSEFRYISATQINNEMRIELATIVA